MNVHVWIGIGFQGVAKYRDGVKSIGKGEVSGVSGVSVILLAAGASFLFWKDLIGALVATGGFPLSDFSFPPH